MKRFVRETNQFLPSDYFLDFLVLEPGRGVIIWPQLDFVGPQGKRKYGQVGKQQVYGERAWHTGEEVEERPIHPGYTGCKRCGALGTIVRRAWRSP